AQALFLSGLWFFLHKMKEEGTQPRSSQVFAGLLWGCMFLTKLDALFLCVLCLMVFFAIFPRKSEDLFQWRLFFVLILTFLSGAILYQLYNADYMYVVARIVAASRRI